MKTLSSLRWHYPDQVQRVAPISFEALSLGGTPWNLSPLLHRFERGVNFLYLKIKSVYDPIRTWADSKRYVIRFTLAGRELL